MDVLLALILSCSLHPDDDLVLALASKLSQGNQFFVGDLSNLETYDGAKSAADALGIATRIKGAGGRPAIGYLAVPLEWAARFGRTPDDLTDGCTNIAIATAMLADFARVCSAGPARPKPSRGRPPRRRRPNLPALRPCILARLETEMNITGVVAHVLPVASRLSAAPPDRDTDPPAASSPIYPDGKGTSDARRDWSSPRMFIFSPTASSPGTSGAAPAATSSTAAAPPSPRPTATAPAAAVRPPRP
jgi:hypothetical protein